MVAMMGLVAASTPERRAQLCPLRRVMPQVAQPGVCAGIDERLDLDGRAVVAGVVDNDQLGEALAGHGRVGLFDEAPDVAGLVQGGNYDGDAHQAPLSLRTRRDAPRYSVSGRNDTSLQRGLPS